MHVEELRTYCLAKKGVTEGFPFDKTTLVFKVSGKIFALTGLNRQPPAVNLKCEPEYAIQLREEYGGEITPAFHMNKTHWNTVQIQSTVSHTLILKLIDHSYELVVKKLTKKQREAL